jgi:hypothetical protein
MKTKGSRARLARAPRGSDSYLLDEEAAPPGPLDEAAPPLPPLPPLLLEAAPPPLPLPLIAPPPEPELELDDDDLPVPPPPPGVTTVSLRSQAVSVNAPNNAANNT